MFKTCSLCETAEEPEPPPDDTYPEFSVYIERGAEEHIGLTVDSADGETLHVVSVLDGPVDVYNNNIPRDPDVNVLPVQAGDYIYSVNGFEKQAKEMLEQLKFETSLTLQLARPRFWTVRLNKGYDGAKDLGLDINWHPIASSLLIRYVAEGLVTDWNRNNAGFEVQANDRIVEANGVVAAGNVAPLIDQLLLEQPQLVLVLSRLGSRDEDNVNRPVEEMQGRRVMGNNGRRQADQYPQDVRREVPGGGGVPRGGGGQPAGGGVSRPPYQQQRRGFVEPTQQACKTSAWLAMVD